MAFLEIVIPDSVEKGVSYAPMFNTSIQKLRGGAEYRNSLWSAPMRQISMSYGTRNLDSTAESLIDFVMKTKGNLHGFRVKDWSDFEAVNQQIAIADGVSFWFRMTKSYGTEVRRIMKPDPETVTIYLDGLEVNRNSYFIDSINGVVIFLSTPLDGQIVSWSGEFHVPVRFIEDSVEVILQNYRVGSVGSTDLQEIRVRESINEEDYRILKEFLSSYSLEELGSALDLLDLHINTNWRLTA